MDAELEQELLYEVHDLRKQLETTRNGFRDGNIATLANEQEVETLDNLPNFDSVHLLKAHSGRIHQVCWSHNDDTVLSVGADSFVCLWDTKTGLIKNLVDTTLNQATTVDVSPEMDIIYCGGLYANVEAFTLNHRSAEDGYSEYVTSTLFEHSGRINCITYLQDRRLLTAAAGDGAVLWDIEYVKPIEKFSHRSVDVLCTLPLSPDGESFLTGASDGIPRIWDRRQAAALVSTLAGHESELSCMEMLPNENNFVTGSDDTSVNLYDLRLDCSIASYTKPLGSNQLSSGRSSLKASENWSSEAGGVTGVSPGNSRQGDAAGDNESTITPGVSGIGVSSSGRIVLSGCRDSCVYVWDLCDTSGPVRVHTERGPIVSLKMAHGKNIIALLTWDPKTRLQIIRPS